MMKSKFFSLNAKLALAVLAVGTMFTGCYDSENGDVNKPYVAPDPVYYVAGTVTDLETGEALDAAVSIDGGEPVTAVGGNYSIKTTDGDNKTVTVTMEGYQDVTRTINIPTVGKGETYTAVVDVAMVKNPSELNVKVTLVSKTRGQVAKVMTPVEYPGLDLTAADDPTDFERTFEVVRGYAIQGEIPASVSPELTEYINQYLGENVGEYGNLKYVQETRLISLNAWECLASVTWTYDVDTLVYTFTTADETADVTVKGVAGYQFTYAPQPNHNFTHSHGHGHGEDGNMNAGGGILTPEM